MQRFHCGSHYSNPGIVLHYLARLSPYIDANVELHGQGHDSPDRAFAILAQSSAFRVKRLFRHPRAHPRILLFA